MVEIHGGVPRDQRHRTIHALMNDPEVVVLVANDAAGEGGNLQRAHQMVNDDLPRNPNRLEQRFGQIHRIGQKEVCHLWNLLAMDTRERGRYEVTAVPPLLIDRNQEIGVGVSVQPRFEGICFEGEFGSDSPAPSW